VAAHHLPAETALAVRLDVEQGILYQPVREQWMPLVGEALGDPRGPQDGMDRLKRFEERSGFRRIDLREIVLGLGATPDDWVLVLSGLFPKENAARRILAALEAEGITSFKPSPEGLTLSHVPTGLGLGQAADGALVLASGTAVLARALPAQNTFAALGLPVEPAAGFAAKGEFFWGLAPAPLAFAVPGIAEVRNVARLTGTVELADPLVVEIQVHPVASGDPARLKEAVERLLSALRTLALLDPRPDVAGERTALSRAVVGVKEDGIVAVSFTWQRAEVDQGAQAAAELIRRAFFSAR
jgi:hypothetical protein